MKSAFPINFIRSNSRRWRSGAKIGTVLNLRRRFATLSATALLALTPMTAVMSASTVPLGAASSFAVLGFSTVTNVGPTLITGDLGVSPGLSVTGFAPGIVTGGTIHVADAVAAAAQADATTAYGLLAAQACDTTFAAPTDMAGMTLLPGTYCFNSSAANTGLLTLNGGGDSRAVWVFKAASTLVTGSGSSVVAINGAQACNVFWQVGSSATLGTGTAMLGSILALASVTVNTNSSLSGRALARTGAVTLDTNVVSVCSLAPYVAPALTKAFSPTQINAGAISTLTITLSNLNPFLITLTAPLIDTLPAGVVIAPTPNASTTCGGGVAVNAIAGTNTVTLPTGRTISTNGTCTISVDVTAALVGSYINTLPVDALQTTNGNNPAPAIATLDVVAVGAILNPSLSKSFSPATINAGGNSTLTITLANANATVATTTAVLTDTLPPGVFVASPLAASTTCGGGATVSATIGGNSVALAAGRTIAPNSSCTVTVNVTAPSAGSYVNTLAIGALQTSNGNNLAAAAATLTVVAGQTLLLAVAPTSVPTLGEWTLVLLGALLFTLGFVSMRRR